LTLKKLCITAGLVLALTGPAVARADTVPTLIHDVRTGSDPLGSKVPAAPDPIQDYVQPDTQAEPSIAVNPANPLNVVTAYQEGRIADGGDATNGFATSFDGGATWTSGELPGLTTYPGQGGVFQRASDAVVAFVVNGDTSLAFLPDGGVTRMRPPFRPPLLENWNAWPPLWFSTNRQASWFASARQP